MQLKFRVQITKTPVAERFSVKRRKMNFTGGTYEKGKFAYKGPSAIMAQILFIS